MEASWLIARNLRSAGLGNRLRVLLSAEGMAEYTGREFVWTWPLDHRFSAPLRALWTYEGGRHVPQWTAAALAAIGRRVSERDDLASLQSHRLLVLETPHAVPLPEGVLPWSRRLQALRPAPDVARRIEAVRLANLGREPYVGVMVRAHARAHERTKSSSPPSWFLSRLIQLRRETPGVRVFLSCDDSSVETQIKTAFPDLVVTPDKSAYNSRGGVQDAVVDLYLLAGASHVVAPHWTSSLELVTALGPPSLTVETPVEPPPVAAGWRLSVAEDPLQPWVR